MKKLCLFLILFFVVLHIMANPISPRLLSEVWIGNDNHIMAEICPFIISYFDPIELSISVGGINYPFPEGYAFPADDSMRVIDLTELLPGFSINPAEDSMCVVMDYGDYDITFDWNVWGNDIDEAWITPLQAGQSYVQHVSQGPFGISSQWCKDEVPTPMQYPYTSMSRAWLDLHFINQDGIPVPNVFCYADLNSYTNEAGIIAGPVLTGRMCVYYILPDSTDLYHTNAFWLEPNQVYADTIQVYYTVSANHTTIPPLKAGLRAYPSPFSNSVNNIINIRYTGDQSLKSNSKINIYNIKGEYVETLAMPKAGLAAWKPGKSISTGVYIMRLISGNRIVDSTTLTIIK